jgi:Fur family ferric uptake transcriptional regulator
MGKEEAGGYPSLIEDSGLASTPARAQVLEILANSQSPLTAREIHATLARTQAVDRTTVYRSLDVFVEAGLAERITSGDRAFRYGMGRRSLHARHPHFFCRQCGDMECLSAGAVELRMEDFVRTFAGLVERVEVRMDGICKNCLRRGGAGK